MLFYKNQIMYSMLLLRENISGVRKVKDREMPFLPETGFGINGIDIVDTDPFGSYTGNPKDPNEKPVQDADDL